MTQEVGEQSVINVIYHLFDFLTASADRVHVREPPTNESAGRVCRAWLTPAGCGAQVRGQEKQHVFIFQLFSWRNYALCSQHPRPFVLFCFVF